MTGMLTVTMITSFVLGVLGITAFIWALKGGQFDDEEKFTHGALFDDVDELNDAIKKEKKLENFKKNG